MSNRHLARTIAMQSLYEWDFNGSNNDKIEKYVQHNLSEFAPAFDDNGFTLGLVKSVIDKVKEVDAKIQEYAPEWPLEQITITDRNILRIGVFELLISHEIPAKVAINEAIELAKTFGGPSSSKFVNGVLGAIYNDMVKEGKIKQIDIEIEARKKAEQEELLKQQHAKEIEQKDDDEKNEMAQITKKAKTKKLKPQPKELKTKH